jgi:hypothetical protein
VIQAIELPSDTAVQFWVELEKFVDAALVHDQFDSTSSAELREQVSVGYAKVLVCADGEDLLAASVVQIFRNHQGERVLHIVTTAGENAERWFGAFDELLDHIVERENCDAITFHGRPGWARLLRDWGFKTNQITMRRENGWNKQEQQPRVVGERIEPGIIRRSGATAVSK